MSEFGNYDELFVDSTGGISARNAANSQRANRNAQAGKKRRPGEELIRDGEGSTFGDIPDQSDSWVPQPPDTLPPGTPIAPPVYEHWVGGTAPRPTWMPQSLQQRPSEVSPSDDPDARGPHYEGEGPPAVPSGDREAPPPPPVQVQPPTQPVVQPPPPPPPPDPEEGYGPMPGGYDAANTRWDAWLRTAGGRDHTAANIMGVLQSIFPGQFNKAGLTAALPTLQWLFGSHLKIVGTGGDKIDFGGSLGIVDLIRDVKGEHGGTAWIWLPDKDNTNLHGGRGGRVAGPGGGPPGGYQPSAGGGQQNPTGTGQGGWFDPTQTPVVNFPAPGTSTQYTPGTAPADGLPTHGGFQFTNTELPVYQQVNYDPNITYRPGQVSQFQAPDQSALNQLQGTTVQQMLTNPTLSDQVLAQMREQHKDTVLSMGEQLGQQASQRAAARGTFGGGTYGSSLGDIQRSMVGDITKGYRDLNVQAADINRQARERALAASEDVLSGQMNRGIAGYQAGLGGQMAQEGLYQQGAESLRSAELLRAQEHQRAFQNQLANQAWLREGQQLQAGEGRFAFGTEQQASQDAFGRYLSGEQLLQQRAQQELERYQTWANQQTQQQQLAIQAYLGRGSLAAGQDQLALQRIQEQNKYNKWQWENFGNFLGQG